MEPFRALVSMDDDRRKQLKNSNNKKSAETAEIKNTYFNAAKNLFLFYLILSINHH